MNDDDVLKCVVAQPGDYVFRVNARFDGLAREEWEDAKARKKPLFFMHEQTPSLNGYARRYNSRYVNVYKFRKRACLIDMSDARNIELLKAAGIPDMELEFAFNIARGKVVRLSQMDNDFELINWLCAHGYHGWIAPELEARQLGSPVSGKFHPELVVCDVSVLRPIGAQPLEGAVVKFPSLAEALARANNAFTITTDGESGDRFASLDRSWAFSMFDW